MHLWPTDFWQGAKTIQQRKEHPFQKIRAAGYPHTKEWNCASTSHHIQTCTQNGDGPVYKELKLETAINFYDFGLDSGFLRHDTKSTRDKRKNELDCINILNCSIWL